MFFTLNPTTGGLCKSLSPVAADSRHATKDLPSDGTYCLLDQFLQSCRATPLPLEVERDISRLT